LASSVLKLVEHSDLKIPCENMFFPLCPISREFEASLTIN
jgi:hypothetical protein